MVFGSRSWFASAFAAADSSVARMSLAAARGVNCSAARACTTDLPRMCTSTTRALRAEPRTKRDCARTRLISSSMMGAFF